MTHIKKTAEREERLAEIHRHMRVSCNIGPMTESHMLWLISEIERHEDAVSVMREGLEKIASSSRDNLSASIAERYLGRGKFAHPSIVNVTQEPTES